MFLICLCIVAEKVLETIWEARLMCAMRGCYQRRLAVCLQSLSLLECNHVHEISEDSNRLRAIFLLPEALSRLNSYVAMNCKGSSLRS